MKRIALYHIETLLWISRLGTFAAAAERLNTTQPAVSARIRELENQIGFPLFQRAGRNMALTIRGRQFVEECEPLWTSIEAMLLQSGQFAGASGTVRIGAGEIAAATCLPPFLSVLKTTLPRARLEIEIDLSQSLLQKLLNAGSDLIIVAGQVASPQVETAPIGSVDLIWIASPMLAAEIGEDVCAAPMWLLHRHSPIHGLALAELGDGAPPEAMINSCNNVRALIDIVLRDGGVSFVPEVMVRDHIASEALVRLHADRHRSIEFSAVIRAQERDPLVRSIFQQIAALRIDPDRAAV
ncbi:LysR family transcriptional regulator [Sphingomonas sp. SRS2]|uniref:LysR family transcriptional regulator n=1 Tax=Sphingomonas sp. SRS2 TaxID=133190 RepID=UPI0006184584|nr:LysR family transcriptional regulator [Sphingomonas sp. SRS2]KKC27018.1 LysR family transcriptional regulator [Sphingomonas sp. SRS2]